MEHKFLAQTLNVNGVPIEGPLQGIDTISNVINRIIPIVFAAASVIVFISLIWGGFTLMTSQGNPEKIKSAQAKIKTAILGFVLLVTSYAVVRLISQIFGIGLGIF